jgi:hypothetical protein
MKLGLFAAMLLLASCASPRPYPPGPNTGASPTSENKNANMFSRDAYECEREAALSGAGGKAEAFNKCMRARGHGSKP